MKRPLLAAPLALAMVALIFPGAAQSAGTITASTDALALGRSMMADAEWVTGASFVAKAPGDSAGLVSGDINGLPTSGEQALVLSTGAVGLMTSPNTSGSSGTSLGGNNVRGNTDFDVTVLKVDLEVPATANCLVGMDFKFYSEEYPEYVNSSFNDAFIAELDESTWTTNGSTITAPGNFAFDPDGSPISINAAGATSMLPELAEGTTFDGATPLLTAATPITPGAHSLYLSIFDQGDRFYDSAVIVDNLRLGRVADVETDCTPGATVVDNTTYVGLGDSYSSGFGVSPYEPGTNKDLGDNDCQRSTRAYAELVAQSEDLDLTFKACQGAVTEDFYYPRNTTWGEDRQLDYLTADTGLVTLGIGGNDAKFGDVLAECILGFELLPFNTCYNDDKVTEPVQEAMDRLDGRASAPSSITPYNTLYQDVRNEAGRATAVAVGYPFFFPGSGGDRTFLPGGRCEGVKKADQRWMVEKIDELNGIIERNALRNGFLFANPNPRFEGHELCGELGDDEEWIFGLLSDGRVHPTAEGQAAMADSVLAALDTDGFERFTITPAETIAFSLVVGGPREFVSIVTGWPGSDVSTTLRSPSGRVIDRSTAAGDVRRITAPTHEKVEVDDPEVGTWTVLVTGEDVPASGEPVSLSMYQAPIPNQRPTARILMKVVGEEIILDGSGSTDPDGQITSHTWYVSNDTEDEVFTTTSVTLPKAAASGRTVTLVVTDDGALTDFAELSTLPVDVMPGSAVNPIKLGAKGVTPVAVLTTPSLDATTLDWTSITAGPGSAAPEGSASRLADADGDGDLDLVLHFRTQSLGLSLDDTQLCVEGTLPDGESFTACDVARTQ